LGQVSGQISRIDVFGSIKDRPEKTSSALNYLVVGSDTREGLTKEQIKALRVGSTAVAAGGRSDTMLLVHISKARDAAYIVSIPRDTLVTMAHEISQHALEKSMQLLHSVGLHFLFKLSKRRQI
jgi:anionic cell wall polymer biosynthesis LytR-Cps2A-Psr (LCP) family protein